MWKYVGQRCRLAIEPNTYNYQVRSNFGTSEPCIGIPPNGKDANTQSTKVVRRYNRTGCNNDYKATIAKLCCFKPILSSDILERVSKGKQKKTEWDTGHGHIIVRHIFICFFLCEYVKENMNQISFFFIYSDCRFFDQYVCGTTAVFIFTTTSTDKWLAPNR